MRVEDLYDAIEADMESGGEYDNDYEVMVEDGQNRRFRVTEHRVGVDAKGMPCLMLRVVPE